MPRFSAPAPENINVFDWDGRGWDSGADTESDSGSSAGGIDEEIKEFMRHDEAYYDTVEPETAGAEFCALLVDMKRSSQRMTAGYACQLAFWAARAGIAGPARKLARKPGRQSGKYSETFDRFTEEDTKVSDGSMYYLHDVATCSRTSVGVKRVNVPTKPPHECLAEELVGNADALELLEKAKRDGDLPPSYFDHPIVQQHADDGEPVWPLALYIDGIQVQDREGVIAVLLYCLITRLRHLVGLDKNTSCAGAGVAVFAHSPLCGRWCTGRW